MAMQIHGSYDAAQADYAEQLKEKQAAKRAEQAKEAKEAAAEQESAKLSEPQDAYISSEKSGQKPTGLYRVEQDENGNRKIFFDDPKAGTANKKEAQKADEVDAKEPKTDKDSQGKPAKTCVADTNAVDREIRKLKEKKQELEQQIQSASGDEQKVQKLEKALAQVEQELSQKDNDTYRRQHTVFSQTK